MLRNVALLAFILVGLAAPARALKDDAPQSATAEDMKIFTPYIGEFRSPTQTFDDSDVEYYFTVEYQWFDKDKTIVKYVVAMQVPAQERTLVTSEGFYGFDPFNDRLYVFGAFSRGMSGWGAVGRFDHETGARETWAKSIDPDGVLTQVRDAFEVIDADSWKNVTRLRQGDETEWRVVHEGVYTRVN